MPRFRLVALLATAAALIAPGVASATPVTEATIAADQGRVTAIQTRVDALRSQITLLQGQIQVREAQINALRPVMQSLLANPATMAAAGPLMVQIQGLTAQNVAAQGQIQALAVALGEAMAELAVAKAKLASDQALLAQP